MTENEMIGIILGAGIFIILLVIALCIPVMIAEWKLFKKAGKHGWEIFIPFYSTWVLIEIAGLNWWYFLISIPGTILTAIEIENIGWLTTIASYFISFITYYNIAKKMKQNEVLYGILGIFVPYVAVLILGFSKSITFDNTIEVSPNGPFGTPKTNNNPMNTNVNVNNTPERYCLGCGQKLENNAQFCQNCGRQIQN